MPKMEATHRTFRLFVSSTFVDFRLERTALHESVFPLLHSLCAHHGCNFQPIDLRWGISDEAEFDHKTIQICLGEIERCRKTTTRPNFLFLLGNRYGWRRDLSFARRRQVRSSAASPRQRQAPGTSSLPH